MLSSDCTSERMIAGKTATRLNQLLSAEISKFFCGNAGMEYAVAFKWAIKIELYPIF